MDHFAEQYQFWIEKLGWVTAEMLCVLTREVSRAELPGGRDRPLERFLAQAVRERKIVAQSLNRSRVYGLARGQGRPGNLYHDVMAAQAAVKFWVSINGRTKTFFSPSDFFAQNCPVVPDFGITVKTSQGVHAFALEYQTFKEAARTTQSKIRDYWKDFDAVRRVMGAEFLWVVFILERDWQWIQDLARSLTFSFVYLLDAVTFFRRDDLVTSPIFLTESGRLTSLLEKV